MLSVNEKEEIHKAGKKQPEHYCLHFCDFLDFQKLYKYISEQKVFGAFYILSLNAGQKCHD